MIDALHEGVLLEDAEARVLAANAHAQRLLGLTLDQMPGAAADPQWYAVPGRQPLAGRGLSDPPRPRDG